MRISIDRLIAPVLSILLLSTRSTTAENEALRTIGTVLDYESECLRPLLDADSNSDSILQREEFIAYVQSYTNDERFQVEFFGELPLTLVQEYIQWICAGYCNFFNSSDCLGQCQDGIPLAQPPGSSGDDLRIYLYTVCDNVIQEVGRIVDPGEDDDEPVGDDDVDPPGVLVDIPFGVANWDNLDAEAIADNSVVLDGVIGVALDALQLQVQKNLFVERIGATRHLEVISLDSYVNTIDDQACSSQINSTNLMPNIRPKCQRFNGVFKIAVTGDSDLVTATTQVRKQANTFINNGDFNGHLPGESKEKFIIYSLDPIPGGTDFPYYIVGIALGASLVGLFAARSLVVNRRRRGSQLPGDECIDSDSESTAYGRKLRGIDDEDVEAMRVEKGQSVVIGAYSEASRDESESDDVGSSGWSSSAGMSSLNTGASVDSAEFFGSSLAAIGAASNVHKKFLNGANKEKIYPIKSVDESSQSDGSDPKRDSDFDMSPGRQQRQMVSRDDLEKQIEDGDWASVGATAAVLASDSRSTEGSVSSVFSTGSSSGLSSALSGTSRDRARAAELDRLVESGDWDGVVLAAAKFEAESDRDDRTDGSTSGKSSYRSATDRSFANLSIGSPKGSVSTNMSEVKRAEMRSEVESLVRRVVPEEIDNVDEMMLQFQGREEELVETLRTMQERSIAARQREAGRRNAKREAKKLAKDAKKALSGLPPKSTPKRAKKSKNKTSTESPRVAQSKAEVEKLVNSMDTMSVPSKGDSNVSDDTPQRLALDKAIAACDWEAVGRTAEQLGEASDSSVNTSDFESAASANELDSSGYLSTTSRPDTERAAELDELIEENDWSGVAAAASRFSSSDAQAKASTDEQKSKSSGSSGSWKRSFLSPKNKSVPVDGSRDKETKKEEEEARAQAEIWSTIAEQNKAKGSNAIGASDAADWAISRSLKQIQDTSSGNQVETQSVDSSNDDTSV